MPRVQRRVPRAERVAARSSRRIKRQGALPRARKDALFGIRIPEATASASGRRSCFG